MVPARRHQTPQRVLIAGAELAVVLLISGCPAFSNPPVPAPRQQSRSPQNQANSTQSQSATDERGTIGQPLIIQALPPPETNQETERNTEKELRDAAAEWGTLVIAGLTLIVLFLQLVVFGRQANRLKQTIETMQNIDAGQTAKVQESIAQATRAANAMEDFARAAMKQEVRLAEQADMLSQTLKAHDQAREIAILQSRPWLTLRLEFISSLGRADWSPNPKVGVVVRSIFANKGSIAAQSVVVNTFIRQAEGSISEWLDGLIAHELKAAEQDASMGQALLPSEGSVRPEHLFMNEDDFEKPTPTRPAGVVIPVIGIIATYRPIGLNTKLFYSAKAFAITSVDGKIINISDLPISADQLALGQIYSAVN